MTNEFQVETRPRPDGTSNCAHDWQQRAGAALSDRTTLATTPSIRQAMEEAGRQAQALLGPLFFDPTPVETQATQIGNNEITIRSRANGQAFYCQDESGQWDSRDGRTWIRRGGGYHVWRGTVSLDRNNNYIQANSDYGITTTLNQDGTERREILASDGTRYVVSRDTCGIPIYFSNGCEEWTSTDGSNWTNRCSGETMEATVSIDRYGEFRLQRADSDVQVHRSRQRQAIVDLQRDLTHLYGVRFPTPDETIRYDASTRLQCGVPTLEELRCLADTLRRTQHEDYRNMRIWFIPASGTGSTVWGYYSTSMGQPNMVLLPRARVDIRGWSALEGTLLHELVHHEQYQRWGNTYFGYPGSHAETSTLIDRLGWEYSAAHGTCLLRDREGGRWNYNSAQGVWNWVSGAARPTDGVLSVDSQGMRQRALVRPATNYFTYPSEEQAEGMAMFRMDRAGLARTAPDLYRIMRDYDQQSIDRRFGHRLNGRPRMIRDIDGSLIQNTPQARRSIHHQERRWGVR